MNVRENLFKFMEERTQHQDFDYYWIDQLCIDQTDLEELSSQVCMMSEIYRQCSSVILWLGSDDPLLHEAARQFSRNMNREALVTILRDHYFSRLWVVQEILLAPNVRVLVRGNHWLSWTKMRKVFYKWNEKQLRNLVGSDS